MRTDLDTLLLDHLFQPAADRAAAWISCFGLARLALGMAIGLQLMMVTVELSRIEAQAPRLAGLGITLLALFGAQQAWLLILRTERQARCGTMNLRRITLRWQRLAWLAVTVWSAVTGISAEASTAVGLCGTCLSWLSVIYFVSCTAAPPPERTALRAAIA